MEVQLNIIDGFSLSIPEKIEQPKLITPEEYVKRFRKNEMILFYNSDHIVFNCLEESITLKNKICKGNVYIAFISHIHRFDNIAINIFSEGHTATPYNTAGQYIYKFEKILENKDFFNALFSMRFLDRLLKDKQNKFIDFVANELKT